jgi:hypothetical protein
MDRGWGAGWGGDAGSRSDFTSHLFAQMVELVHRKLDHHRPAHRPPERLDKRPFLVGHARFLDIPVTRFCSVFWAGRENFVEFEIGRDR